MIGDYISRKLAGAIISFVGFCEGVTEVWGSPEYAETLNRLQHYACDCPMSRKCPDPKKSPKPAAKKSSKRG